MAPSTLQDITSGSECIPGPWAIHSDPSVYILYCFRSHGLTYTCVITFINYNVNNVVAKWSQGSHNVVTEVWLPCYNLVNIITDNVILY